MFDPKFSAGPWHPGCLGTDSSCQCAYVLDEGHAGGIATVHIDNGIASIADGGNDAPSREEAIANMHLISAAPDLFSACVEAAVRLRYAGDVAHDQGMETRAQADWNAADQCLAAIEKALNERRSNDVRIPRSQEGEGEFWERTRNAMAEWARRELASFPRSQAAILTFVDDLAHAVSKTQGAA